jgi:glycyl-tRNA synthetase (class II)
MEGIGDYIDGQRSLNETVNSSMRLSQIMGYFNNNQDALIEMMVSYHDLQQEQHDQQDDAHVY